MATINSTALPRVALRTVETRIVNSASWKDGANAKLTSSESLTNAERDFFRTETQELCERNDG